MTVTAVRGTFEQRFVSPLNILKPERWKEVAHRYGDQFKTGFMFLRSQSAEYPTARTEYSWNEEDRYYQNIKVAANVASPGAGNNITFTLSPDSLDANNNFFPRIKQSILFKGGIPGQIININTAVPSAPTITVRPNSSTDAIPALTADEELILFTNAHAEGTGQPIGTVPTISEFSNNTQILKETFSATGTEMTDQTWLRLDGEDGAAWSVIGMERLDFNIALQADGALWHNKPNTNNIVDPENNLPIGHMQGFIPAIIERGNLASTPPGTFNVTDFDAYDRTLARERASGLVCALSGKEKLQEMNNSLQNYFRNFSVSDTTQMVVKEMYPGMTDDNGMAMKGIIDWTAINKNGRNFVFKEMITWYDPTTYGSEGYLYKNSTLLYPMGKTQYDTKLKKNFETLAIRYKSHGGIDRYYKMWKVGGSVLSITDIDIDNTYVRMDIGAQHMGVNQCIWDDAA